MSSSATTIHRQLLIKFRYYILGLCAFIWFLSFKPSEPYLSQYLICNLNTQQDYCQTIRSSNDCNNQCQWNYSTNTCSITNCESVSESNCNIDDNYYNYCTFNENSNLCEYSSCYKKFSEDQVNNNIYPWSTYAYFPFLLILGPFAEIFSYRIAILVGILGRVVTRFLLLYGNTLIEMQLMQVSYAMGTAAEDVFSAYIYYAVPQLLYTDVTAYVKSSALVASLLSGILGDVLVTQFNASLKTLMIISAAFVCTGAFVGFFVILPSNKTQYSPDSNVMYKSHYQSLKIKLRQFSHQLLFLRQSMKNYNLLFLILYWIIGNAVFTIVYGYEVSIYQELNGSSDWNGSVLSIMLLGGSFGALLTTYLNYDKNGNHISQKIKSTYILVAQTVAIISLFSSIYIWKTVYSVSLLTIYFTSWQYITVIALSDLASGLKLSQTEIFTNDNYVDDPIKNEFVAVDLDASNHSVGSSNNEDVKSLQLSRPDPPYSIAIVTVVCLCVLVQITFQSILFSGLQLSLKDALWNILLIDFAATILYSIYLIISTIM